MCFANKHFKYTMPILRGLFREFFVSHIPFSEIIPKSPADCVYSNPPFQNPESVPAYTVPFQTQYFMVMKKTVLEPC